MKKNYKINYTAQTITITKAFSEMAQNPKSEEYGLLMTFRKDFPEFKIVMPAPKPRKKSRNRKITYVKMNNYIICQKDSTIRHFVAKQNI